MNRQHSRLRPRNTDGIGGAGGFQPSTLFAAGEQGVWYDPSDLATMFQDSAGITPVTAAGQVVGLILDKSGRSNHASQASAASKPILRNTGNLWWLEFDGVDDFLVTATINFTATDKMSLFAGLRKISDAAFGLFAELSINLSTNPGTFTVRAPNGATPDYQMNWSGSTVATANIGSLPAPNTSVLSSTADISGAVVTMRINGSSAGIVQGGALGTGNFSNNPLYIGRRAGTSSPFSGNMYGLIGRGAASNGLTISGAESYMAAKSGVVL
jgi:hypothetical protein